MLDFHPAANLFPALWVTDHDAYKSLCNDIAANGLLEPIWLHEGLIIDGRNRYMACRDTGVEPRFRDWSGEGGSVTQFVISLNMNRRHLTSSQKALIAFHALPLFEAEAKERQRAAGRFAGKDSDGNPIVKVHQRIDEDEALTPKQALDQAAEMAGTNRQYVSDIKAISKKAPELLKKIESGIMTIPEAKRQINESKQEPTKQNIRWNVVGPMLFAAAKMLRNESDRQEAIEVVLRIVEDVEQQPAA